MAMFADAIASQITETLAALAKDEVTMVLGAKEEVRRLAKKVGDIHSYLEDAERRALTKSAADVRSWLAELKDILYDADDVIDYSRTQTEKLALLSPDEHQCSVGCYSPLLSCFPRVALHHKIGSRVRSINERLERVIKDKSDLQLISNRISPEAREDRFSSRIQRQTDPMLEIDIVGAQIENDTSHLVNLCTSAGPAISVLAIIGMGGIGKTTLAQKVYNHNTIKNTFNMPPPAWVCVSQDYNTTNLLREVIKCFDGNYPDGAQSFAQLQVRLTRAIEGRKFFIVLDDVWSSKVWDNALRKPLLKGVAGSRVLITTRDDGVAKQMGAVLHQTVQPLSTEVGWSLLRKMVFPIGGDQEGIQVVGDIGVKIAEKCGGLPLAIKTIAGVLRNKDRTRSEWEKVL